MYERVIVPYDGSERSLSALGPARWLARPFGGEVELLHVTDAAAPPPPTVTDALVRAVVAEDAADALVAAGSEPSNLLCMATRGRGALGETLLGSVAARVLRGLAAPLVLTGPALLAPLPPEGPRRLLVCLDGSIVSAAILPVARRWAQEFDLEVVLLHVAYPLGEPTAGPVTWPEETRAAIGAMEHAAAVFADDGVDADTRVVEDAVPASGIVRHAAHGLADLIALATHGRTGLDRVLVGSVTTDVVRQAAVPVLTLRPSRLG